MLHENFLELCRVNNITPSQLLRELGITQGNIENWKKGNIPSGRTLILLANYFNVTIDSLIDNEIVADTYKEIVYDEIDLELINEIKEADKKIKIDILNYAKYRKQLKLSDAP